MKGNTLPAFSNKRHARIQVRGEKEVLHHFIDFAESSLSVIDLNEEEYEEEISKIRETKHSCIAQYCTVVGTILREGRSIEIDNN